MWAVVRLLGLERGFPLVPLLAYTPYAAMAALAATLLALGLRRWGAALAAGLSAAALIAVVAPRATGDPEPAGSRAVLKVLSANTLGDRGSPQALLDLVRRERPDVLAVQELTPALDARLRAAFPYRVVRPRPGTPGTGLYSRLALSGAPAPAGTAFAWTRALVRLPDGARVDVHSVHPVAPLRRESMGPWRRDLRRLPAAPRRGPPRILAGDFNATLDHAELRRVLGQGYRDAAEVVGAGLRPTWPVSGRRLPPVTIDHVLADARCTVGAARVLRLTGSDHRPVLARLAC